MSEAEDEEGVRRDMRALLRVVEAVRQQHPRMEMAQLSVLLHVTTDPGVRATDLGNKMGLKRSSLSRNVKALSSTSYLRDEEGDVRDGLDLITQIPDATDARAYQLALTRRGRIFAERLATLMRE